jgi:hypothetical protein
MHGSLVLAMGEAGKATPPIRRLAIEDLPEFASPKIASRYGLDAVLASRRSARAAGSSIGNSAADF